MWSIDLPPLNEPWFSQGRSAVPQSLRSDSRYASGSARLVLPRLLRRLGTIDLFVHDSLHTYDHMAFEFKLARAHLSSTGLIVSDDINTNQAFAEMVQSEQTLDGVAITQERSGMRSWGSHGRQVKKQNDGWQALASSTSGRTKSGRISYSPPLGCRTSRRTVGASGSPLLLGRRRPLSEGDRTSEEQSGACTHPLRGWIRILVQKTISGHTPWSHRPVHVGSSYLCMAYSHRDSRKHPLGYRRWPTVPGRYREEGMRPLQARWWPLSATTFRGCSRKAVQSSVQRAGHRQAHPAPAGHVRGRGAAH